MFRRTLTRALPQRLRRPPSGAFVASLSISFMAVFGIATAVGSSEVQLDPAVEKDGQYPATPRIEVARGTLAGVGAYRLLHSRDFKGGMCVGIELLEQGGPPSNPGPVLAEGCGGPEKLNIGKVTAGDGEWTVLHGKVPEGTNTVEVTEADGTRKELAARQDDKGVHGKWVVQKVTGTVGPVEFKAMDGAGLRLADQALGK
jgi:hypothetical protein